MWLFTRYGFYSAVCARTKGGGIDPTRIMVRARSKEHLLTMIQVCDLKRTRISETNGTDYRYRIFLRRTVWENAALTLCEDIDYDNFKNAATAENGHDQYVQCLHQVWRVMASLQDLPPYHEGAVPYEEEVDDTF